MKVLVVGGGGREHAIVWALSKSPKVTQLYCAPGNGGIAALAECVPIKATDVEAMVNWAVKNAMDFVVVAPDDPLALGMVDALEAAGIPAFGPRANAAVIEASKVFSKHLMTKYHIPTAKYQAFTELDAALDYIRREGAPIVVKADGLALGKGVVVAQTVSEAEEAARAMMADGKFGAAGGQNETAGRAVPPADISLIQGSCAAGEKNIHQIALQQGEDRLTLRVAKAGVVLHHLGSLRCEHQTEVEDALEGTALRLQCRDGRQENLLHALRSQDRRIAGGGGDGAHPAGVGA